MMRHQARGFSIIEAAISTVIVAVMLVAALNTLGATARSRRAHAVQRLGPTIATDLMSEIMQATYREDDETESFGREDGEADDDRAAWDDVDDYHGWTSSPPQARDGTPFDEWTGWTRAVQVAYADLADPRLDSSGAADEGLKRITVIVTSPGGEVTELVSLRTSSSTYQMEPALSTEYLTWVGVEIVTSGEDGASAASSVNLLNPVVIGINPADQD